MANLRPAIEVAVDLTNYFPVARVACYHAQHFPIQRFHIESRLDHLLTRKNGDAHILADAEIRALLDSPTCSELMLIVVATPVEEIGRDHDFDWAVIDPSSTQSIVQTAGRVNRHRLTPLDSPNIAILQFNRKKAEGKDQQVFRRPGLEVGQRYKTHDLKKLFDWAHIEQVDARLRFDADHHMFSRLDDASIESATKDIFARITSNDQPGNLWMALDTYTKSPLRNNEEQRIELTLSDDHPGGNWFEVKEEASSDPPVSRSIGAFDKPHPSAWLSLSDEAATAIAQEMSINVKSAMTVTVRATNAASVARHVSFGFYRRAN